MARVATVHHTTGKVIDIACALDRELYLLRYGRVVPMGVRVRIDPRFGIATADLRAAGNSRQKLQNQSSCQMLGLFGGLRQTLTSYAPWQIETVSFTELGEDIATAVRE